MGDLRAGPRSQDRDTARAGPSRNVPGATVPSELHSEGRRKQAPARGRGARRQNRPESSGSGAERDPRGGFPRVLVWVPSKPQPARCAGAVIVGISSKKVNYILDADIRSFFTEVSQQWVVRFLEHRIGDKRIIRLVQKWLRSGILEDGIVTIEEKGTGQGSVISPLLSNIYLHYVFDLWAERWRRREATGDMIMVRYADDTVVGFQHENDARRFRDAMRDRLREFSLSLHPEKTRLIEFGRFAAQNCKRRGRSKPETFKFLGFVLICDKSRRGDFRIRRKSRRDRMCAKLREIKEGLRHRMHRPIPETGKWLAQIVAGYFAYHAVPTNSSALSAFRYHVLILWHRRLCP